MRRHSSYTFQSFHLSRRSKKNEIQRIKQNPIPKFPTAKAMMVRHQIRGYFSLTLWLLIWFLCFWFNSLIIDMIFVFLIIGAKRLTLDCWYYAQFLWVCVIRVLILYCVIVIKSWLAIRWGWIFCIVME